MNHWNATLNNPNDPTSYSFSTYNTWTVHNMRTYLPLSLIKKRTIIPLNRKRGMQTKILPEQTVYTDKGKIIGKVDVDYIYPFFFPQNSSVNTSCSFTICWVFNAQTPFGHWKGSAWVKEIYWQACIFLWKDHSVKSLPYINTDWGDSIYPFNYISLPSKKLKYYITKILYDK